MIIPNTKRHPNNTKTDQLPISEVITGLPRPYHNNPHIRDETTLLDINQTLILDEITPMVPSPLLMTPLTPNGHFRKAAERALDDVSVKEYVMQMLLC